MAVDVLTTAITNFMTRMVLLEPLSIAQVTANTPADDQWKWTAQTMPYWGNRPMGLREMGRDGKWEFTLNARLWIAQSGGTMVETTTPQNRAFQYIPECLRYFQTIRADLAVGAYTALTMLAPEGIAITCPRGLDYTINPFGTTEAFYIDFIIVAPFQLGM